MPLSPGYFESGPRFGRGSLAFDTLSQSSLIRRKICPRFLLNAVPSPRDQNSALSILDMHFKGSENVLKYKTVYFSIPFFSPPHRHAQDARLNGASRMPATRRKNRAREHAASRPNKGAHCPASNWPLSLTISSLRRQEKQ